MKDKKKIINIKPYTIKLEKLISFTFAYFENAQNLSNAIEIGGYFAKITKSDSRYIVDIYKIIERNY